jgi:2-polyprenyl-3-methyl-5-hydroxy-6-metoxy-1,4-benzoquinol methylase
MISRKEHWENVYQTKDHKKAGWYQESPDVSLELLSKIHAESSQSIIDVGCGASVLADKLIEQGYKDITLVDLSEEALSIIKDRLGDKGNIQNYFSQDKSLTSFWWGFFIVRCFGLICLSFGSKKSSGTIFHER